MNTGEVLHENARFRLSRRGRFLVAELLVGHRVLSTCPRNGGQREDIRYLVNHQSCEASSHRDRLQRIHDLGFSEYHDVTCREIDLPPRETVVMGTAANMNYASVITRTDVDVSVTAVVTAGVQGNATCAGDPAAWREAHGAWEKVAVAGTINTMLLVSHPLTEGALARAVVTFTEAKCAALQRLAVRSLASQEIATGTGTDQYCIAAPQGPDALTSTGPHSKLGEIIGAAVRDATLEALRWQNGLEASVTRGIFHALGRYGLREETFAEDVAPWLTGQQLDLLRRNIKSVVYEPAVSAPAYAMAAVLDRIRYGTLPPGTARQALRYQGAILAAGLAAAPERWTEFYAHLGEADPENPAATILKAVALGWSSKWT